MVKRIFHLSEKFENPEREIILQILQSFFTKPLVMSV